MERRPTRDTRGWVPVVTVRAVSTGKGVDGGYFLHDWEKGRDICVTTTTAVRRGAPE